MFGWRSARGRAVLAGIVFMLLLAVVAAVAVWRAQDDQRRHQSLEQRSEVVTALENARAQAFRGAASITAAVFAEDATPHLDTWRQANAERDEELDQARAGLIALGDTDGLAALDRFTEQAAEVGEETEAIVDFAGSADVSTRIAVGQQYYPDLWPRTEAQLADLDQLASGHQTKFAAERAAADRAADVTLWLLVGISTVAFVGGAAAVTMLIASVVRPLTWLQVSVRAITSGDLKAKARVSGPEEVASLAQGFNEMVSERRRAEERVEHLNSVLRAISNVNQLLVKEKDRERMLKGVCESLIETRGYYCAWIAVVDDSGEPITSAEAGLGNDFLPMAERLKRGELPACGRSALAQSGPLTIEDPPSTCSGCPLANNYGGRGVMVVRLEHDGKVYGLLAASVPAGFIADEEERSLLKEVAGDIAFALHSIQLEEERKEAEEALRESDERYRTLFDRSLDAVYIHAFDGRFIDANEAALRLLGYSRDEIHKLSFADLLDDSHLPAALAAVEEIMKTGRQPRPTTFKLRRKDGSLVEVETVAAAVYEGGRPVAVQGIARDITERRRAEEALRESEERYRDLFENANDLIQSVAPDGSFVYVNRAWRETLGYSQEEIPGLSLLDIIHPDSKVHCTEMFQRVIAGEKLERIEATFVTKDGRAITVEGSASCRFEDGRPVATRGIFRDVTERKRMEEALREQVRRDPLTGVLNHAAIVQELRNLISDGGGGASHAVAMVDVDDLKAVNDTYGHQVGDAVLVEVARALSRDGAIVGRYGGDEFVAVLPGTDREAAERYRDAVLAALAGAALRDPESGASVPVVVSVGLAIYPAEASRIEELIKLADSEMFAAKRQRPVGSAGRALPRPLGSERAAKMVGELVPLLTSPGDLNEKLELVAHRLCVGAGYDTVSFRVLGPPLEARAIQVTFPPAGEALVDQWSDELSRLGDHRLRRVLEDACRPVIVDDPQHEERFTDVERQLARGAGLRSFLIAPMRWQNQLVGGIGVGSRREGAFGPRDAEFLMAVAAQVTAIVRMATLIEELKSASDQLAEGQAETVMLLAAAAEAHDRTTGHHLQSVRTITEALAAELGYKEEDAKGLGLAAVLHDIGKIRIPDSILASTGRLAEEEWGLMKHHTTWGGEFLAGRPGFELAAVIARSHHERWDGSGYPDGLSGEAIPEAATIVAVADAFDAMTSGRPYRAARSITRAVREIMAYSGAQFSARVVQALARLHKRKTLPLTRAEPPVQKAAA